MTITNLNRGGITQKSESESYCKCIKLSSLHFWHGCKKEVAAGFYGNFYFSTLVTNHISQQTPSFKNVMKTQTKMTGRTPDVRFDKILVLSTFEYLTIWHLNIWTFKHWNIGILALGTLNIWIFEHLNVWTFVIWTFEHLNIWTCAHLNIWTLEHLKSWAF